MLKPKRAVVPELRGRLLKCAFNRAVHSGKRTAVVTCERRNRSREVYDELTAGCGSLLEEVPLRGWSRCVSPANPAARTARRNVNLFRDPGSYRRGSRGLPH